MKEHDATPRASSNFEALTRVIDAIESVSEWNSFERVLNKTEMNEVERFKIRRAWISKRLLLDDGALPASEVNVDNITADEFVANLADASTLGELRDLDVRATARYTLGLFNGEEYGRIIRAILNKEQFLRDEQTIGLDYFFKLLHTVEDVEEYTAEIEERADAGEITSVEKNNILKQLEKARERIETAKKPRAKA